MRVTPKTGFVFSLVVLVAIMSVSVANAFGRIGNGATFITHLVILAVLVAGHRAIGILVDAAERSAPMVTEEWGQGAIYLGGYRPDRALRVFVVTGVGSDSAAKAAVPVCAGREHPLDPALVAQEPFPVPLDTPGTYSVAVGYAVAGENIDILGTQNPSGHIDWVVL